MAMNVDISIDEAAARLAGHEDVLMVDVRREEEVQAETAHGALTVPRDMLEIEITRRGVAKDRAILLLCQTGARSRYAALALRALGFKDAWSVDGGFSAWRERGQPIRQIPYLDAEQRRRYARHLSLEEFGIEGQSRLAQATVVLVGAGGLGSPAALYLAAMGVGRIRLIDDDHVELSNLQRQVIHTEASVGEPKVRSAERALAALNSGTVIEAIEQRFDVDSAALLEGADVVINGADNFAARLVLNELCLSAGIPLVDGAVLEFEGQLSVFCHGDGPCYRCLYPDVPPSSFAPSCVAAGVLGIVPGTIGMLQCLEAVKLIAKFGTPLVGQLLVFDALKSTFRHIAFERSPSCTACGPGTPGRSAEVKRDGRTALSTSV